MASYLVVGKLVCMIEFYNKIKTNIISTNKQVGIYLGNSSTVSWSMYPLLKKDSTRLT